MVTPEEVALASLFGLTYEEVQFVIVTSSEIVSTNKGFVEVIKSERVGVK